VQQQLAALPQMEPSKPNPLFDKLIREWREALCDVGGL
jgi:hypothetical protein